MRHWTAAATFLVVAGWGATGCAPPTAMTFEFTTNLPCPDDPGTRYLALAVGGNEAAVEDTFTEVFDATQCDPDAGAVGTRVLGSYTMRPPPGDKQLTVNLRAALAPGGDAEHVCSPGDPSFDARQCITVRRRTRFTPGTVLRVPLDFEASCLGHPCTKDETCTLGGLCVPKETQTSCPATGPCDVQLPGCVIAGLQVAAGDTNPSNRCLRCVPAQSTTSYSLTVCEDDGNPCTQDGCGQTGQCLHTQLDDGAPCGAGHFCRSGECVQGCSIGGVDFVNGAQNPANGCQLCDGVRSASGWSDADDGLACADDANPCTTDSCGAGQCAHDPLADGMSCGTGKVCEAGACVAGCTIAGQFYAAGTHNPANDCQQCDPALAPTAWSTRPSPSTCTDDGNSCTDDLCQGANCAHPSKANGMSCGTGQVCAAGSCGAGCVISGVSVPNNGTNPANPCQSCQSSVSTSAWTAKPNNTACPPDTNGCTNDVCSQGVCTHPPVPANTVACSGTAYCTGAVRSYNFKCNGAGACAAASTQTCAVANSCQTGGGCTPTGCVTPTTKAQGTACTGATNGMCCGTTCVNSGANPNCGICGLNCGTLACTSAKDNSGAAQSPLHFVCSGVSGNAQCTANYGTAATAWNGQCNCQCGTKLTCAPGGKCPRCTVVTGTNYCTY